MSGPPRAVARAALRFIDTAAVVHRTQGLRGFYAGVLPNIMQVSCHRLLTVHPGTACSEAADCIDGDVCSILHFKVFCELHDDITGRAQVLPNAALSYYAYEAFKKVLDAED